jgi:hypothetical protein
VCASIVGRAQETADQVPLVVSAEAPLYPMIARAAHVEGIVRIKVTTDGETISKLDVVSGPAMLAEATKKNIQTCRFMKHKPTQFIAIFEYSLAEPSVCEYENSTSVVHFPLQVHVTANNIQTCDPAATTRRRH